MRLLSVVFLGSCNIKNIKWEIRVLTIQIFNTLQLNDYCTFKKMTMLIQFAKIKNFLFNNGILLLFGVIGLRVANNGDFDMRSVLILDEGRNRVGVYDRGVFGQNSRSFGCKNVLFNLCAGLA